jgi:hypothetical protein
MSSKRVALEGQRDAIVTYIGSPRPLHVGNPPRQKRSVSAGEMQPDAPRACNLAK